MRTARLVAAMLLVCAACGQKPGVAQLTAAGSGATDQVSDAAPAGGGETDQQTTTGASGTTGAGPVTRSTGGTRSGPSATSAAGGARGAVAAGAPDRTGVTRDEIVLGVHAPLTGAAPLDTFSAGIRVYFNYSKNERLQAVGNRHVRVEYADDGFDPSKAISACRQLAEEKRAFLLFGAAGADQIETCAKYATGKGIPYLSAGVHEKPVTDLGTYFAMSESYIQQAPQLAQLMRKQFPANTKLGIVVTDSDLLNDSVDAMKRAAAAAGMQAVDVEKVKKDAAKSETDAHVGNLISAKADIVYFLQTPVVFGFFVQSMQERSYNPPIFAPGLSIGINVVGTLVCRPPFPTVYAFSPMVGLDVIDQYDPDYKLAWAEEAQRRGRPQEQPDDIGVLIWGISKTIRLMLDGAGANLSRQNLMGAIQSGKRFASNVLPPNTFGAGSHLGANTVSVLQLDCTTRQYKTIAVFASSFA